MNLENKAIKCVLLCICIFMVNNLTGCAGLSMQEMKNQGEQLLNEGSDVNDDLISDAKKVNNSIIDSNSNEREGWISELENIAANDFKYRILVASQKDISTKTSVDNIQGFMDNLELDSWELADEFPDNIDYENVLFIQEKISDKNKYKNIINVHLIGDKNIVLVTVAKGLIDLSDEFIPKDDSFTSVYQVPESVTEYLESLSSEN